MKRKMKINKEKKEVRRLGRKRREGKEDCWRGRNTSIFIMVEWKTCVGGRRWTERGEWRRAEAYWSVEQRHVGG